MLEGDGAAVDTAARIVLFRGSEQLRDGHVNRTSELRGNAAIRQPVIPEMLEPERQRGRMSKLHAHDRVDAVSIEEIGLTESIRVFRHGADAERSSRAERQAELRGSPLVVVRAQLQREIGRRTALGPPRDQVDDAAAAAATEQDGGRSLDDLDPLDVVADRGSVPGRPECR